MKQKHLSLEDALPIQLRIRVLQAELEQIELDLDGLGKVREEIVEEIRQHQDFLAKSKRHRLLHRVK
ncbi:MAG: hypothetical protein O6826_10540 [Acidobacteria bacterium]|nr:hypothetical protein [Acidobacteriota bacterium]MCZ6879214.1 hypothetical protein [Acidobacteriota bacterium]